MRFVLLVGASWLLPQLAAADAPDASDREARIARGELVIDVEPRKGQDVPLVRVTTVFKTTPETLWPILDHCGDYKTTMTRVASAQELSRSGNTVRCQIEVEMPFPLDNVTTVTEVKNTVTPGKLYRRRWRQVEGGLKINSGSWTLTPRADGKETLAVYEVVAAPKLDVSAAMRLAAQKASFPGLFDHIRAQVERSP